MRYRTVHSNTLETARPNGKPVMNLLSRLPTHEINGCSLNSAGLRAIRIRFMLLYRLFSGALSHEHQDQWCHENRH